MLHAGGDAALEERARVRRVVAVVLERIADRLGHLDVRGEVQDGIDLVLREHARDERGIAGVALDERAVQHGAAKTGRKVVERDQLFAALAELARDVAADVAGAAGDEDGSHRSSTISCRA